MVEQCLRFGCFWLVASSSPCLAYLAGSTHSSRHIHSPPPNSYSRGIIEHYKLSKLVYYFFHIFAPSTTIFTFEHHIIFAIACTSDSLNPASCLGHSQLMQQNMKRSLMQWWTRQPGSQFNAAASCFPSRTVRFNCTQSHSTTVQIHGIASLGRTRWHELCFKES